MREIAQNLASQGRRGDTMLVHMSPKEVGGLQALARSQGTSLTINPNTGLPEAFNLGRLLPMVAGAALTAFSGGTLSPLTIGLMTGGIGALATGSLKEGLMMGLGAAGGAGLAGSMANLAAPAAAAAAPAGSMVGAPSVMAGAGSGLTVPAAAVNTAGTSLLNTSAIPTVGLQAPANALTLPSLSSGATGLSSLPASVSAAPSAVSSNLISPSVAAAQGASNVAPAVETFAVPPQPVLNATPLPPIDRFSAITQPQTVIDPGAVNAANQSFGLKVPAAPTAEGAATFGGLKPPTQIVEPMSLSTPKPYTERLAQGFEKATSSMGAAGDYLSANKMNLAMASAPMMFAEPEYAGTPESDAMIRPYTLEIDNTSGAPIDPRGREAQRLRYRFVAGEPYRAAQGGMIAFDEGGAVGGDMSPVDRVYASIDKVQRAAGLGAFQPSQIPASMQAMKTLMPARQTANTSPYQYIPVSSTVERNYGIAVPNPEDSPSYRDIIEARKKEEEASTLGAGDSFVSYNRGGDVRRKIDRMSMDPYNFADYRSGRGAYDAAMKNFAQGGLGALPPRFLSGGGDGMSDDIPATIEGKQPARLADGEFVIPADVVSHIGNGSSKAGAKKLHAMMDQVRKKRTGKKKQAPAIKAEKYMPT